MKKIFVYLTLFSTLFAVERYELLKILDQDVYFPKNNGAYIEELLEDKSEESLLLISELYTKLNYKDTALRYLEEYKGENKLKKAEIYEALGEFEKELQILLDMNLNAREEMEVFYNKVKKLSEEDKVNLGYNYNSFELFYLMSKLEDLEEFVKVYKEYEWSQEDKIYIEKVLYNIEFNADVKLKEIYIELAGERKYFSKIYNEIKSYEDTESYRMYFALQDELGIDIEAENNFELLQKYIYNNEEDKIESLYEKMLKTFLAENNKEKLMSLYFVNNNYKLAYNLALENEKLHFKFLNKLFVNEKNEEILKRALEDFKNKYQKTIYVEEIFIFEMKLEKGKNLESYMNYLRSRYSEKILKAYIKEAGKLNDKSEVLKNIEYLIFEKGIVNSEILNAYVYLAGKNNTSKLMLLSNKDYYFSKLMEDGKDIPKFLENEYMEYLEKNSFSKEFLKYKNNFKEDKNKENTDIVKNEEGIKYFYLNDSYIFLVDIAEKLEEKAKLNYAEEYYLMKYYKQEGIKEEEEKNLKKKLEKMYYFD